MSINKTLFVTAALMLIAPAEANRFIRCPINTQLNKYGKCEKIKCDEYSELVNGVCIPCPEGQQQSLINGRCRPNIKPEPHCYIEGCQKEFCWVSQNEHRQHCDRCQVGWSKTNRYSVDLPNDLCHKCHDSNCTDCSIDMGVCRSCNAGFYLRKGYCIPKPTPCPQGCKNCIEYRGNGTSVQMCKECLPTYNKDQSGNCVKNDLYFKGCLRSCDYGCLECSNDHYLKEFGQQITGCVKKTDGCGSGFNLGRNGEGVKACISVSVTVNNKNNVCGDYCLQCAYNKGCTRCERGTFLKEESGYGFDECVSNCGQGYQPDYLQGRCVRQEQDKFNCNSYEVWTTEKTIWCCANKQIGCLYK